MNLVDLLIVLAVVAAGSLGFATGLATQAGMLIGLFCGMAVGVWGATEVADRVSSPSDRTAWVAVVLVVSTGSLAALGALAGQRISAALGRAHLSVADKATGALLSAAEVLLVVWLLAGTFASQPGSEAGDAMQDSTIVRALDRALPPAPDAVARLRALLDPLGFPQVFAGLEPNPSGPVPPPTDAELRAAVAAAGPSTVKILAVGCDRSEGSGFVAAPGLVLTNAHVVAGSTIQTVVDAAGSHEATVLAFDPETDVAVLQAADLAGPVLDLTAEPEGRGAVGAVLGYPEDGPLVVAAAAVRADLDALGRDIYGRGLVTRRVYELQTTVRPGSSGGPFVLPDGSVAGMVFARSVSDPAIGYALTADELRPALDRAATQPEPAATGACTRP